MAIIQPDGFSQLAQLLQFSNRIDETRRRATGFAFRPGNTGTTIVLPTGETDSEYRRRLGNIWREALAGSFDVSTARGKGFEFAHEAWAMYSLVRSGRLSEDEANEFLATRYPSVEFSAGKFQDLLRYQNSIRLNDLGIGPVGDLGYQNEIQRVLQQQASSGISSPLLSENNSTFYRIQHHIKRPRITEEYEPENISEAFSRVASDASLALNSIANGAVSFPPGSLDGSVIRQGSIPVDRIDPISMGKLLRDMPGPDEAIELTLVPDQRTDRFLAYDLAVIQGPGRVWKVAAVKFPTGFTPAPGPTRYRLIKNRQRFGLMSMMYADGRHAFPSQDGIALTYMEYGIVIRGIPNLLDRIPEKILYTTSAHPPTQMTLIDNGRSSPHVDVLPLALDISTMNNNIPFESTGTTTGRVFNEFGTSTTSSTASNRSRGFLRFPDEDISGVDPPLGQIQPQLQSPLKDDVRGFRFNLITGTTAKMAFAQLNSKKSFIGTVHLGGNSRGAVAMCPDSVYMHGNRLGLQLAGQQMDSPCPVCLVEHTSIAPVETTNRTISDLGGTATDAAWIEGIPFVFDDCEILKATPESFSVVVRPTFEQIIIASEGNDQASPARWWTTGIETFSENGREWAVDIIVV